MQARSQQLSDLAARAAGEHGLDEGLRALGGLRDELEQLEHTHVAEARRNGWSWRQIADTLGVAKQTVHRKHAGEAQARAPGHRSPQRGQVLITAEARRGMRLAREEAGRLGHRCVRPDHVLLGLLQLASGPTVEALRAVGASLPSMRPVVAAKADPDGTAPGITAQTRRVLERALQQTVRRHDGWLGEEHLLLSLLEAGAIDDALAAANTAREPLRRALETRLAARLRTP